MKRVPVNFSVVLFLMAVIYFTSTAKTSFRMSARSDPLVCGRLIGFRRIGVSVILGRGG